MLTGLNHLTLAVRDLERSFVFYTAILGQRPHARWDAGAYLSLDALWLCLSLDPARAGTRQGDYTHFAFGAKPQDFQRFVTHARSHGVLEWKANRSEGDSFYFLDPDGHQLEVHVGSLQSRLAACQQQPYAGMRFFS